MAFSFFKSGGQQSSSSSSFADNFLQSTNDYRSKHQAPPLRLNSKISSTAQRWADNLAKTNSFKHSSSAVYNDEQLGENIAMKWTSDREQYTGSEVADLWYSEIKNYNFNSHSGPKTGHFTQLVWKGSREVGIGKATGPKGECLVVANFYPAGNYVGRHAENVLPPRDGKVTLTVKPTNPSPAKNDAVESIWSRATPAAPGNRLEIHSNSPRLQVRQTVTQDRSSSPSTSRLSQNYTTESRFASATQRQVRQETTGSGPNAVTKTIVIETVRGPDGSVKTVQKETVSKGDQRVSDNNYSDFSKGTVPSSDKKSWFSSTSSSRGAGAKAGACGPAWETTAAAGKGSASRSIQTMKEFQEDVVRSHNKYRRQHGRVGDLRANRELNDLAQRWADSLAASETKSLRHSDAKFKGQNVGENIASKFGTGSVEYSGEEVVDQWYGEIVNYNFRSPDTAMLNFQKTGHFTQVIWKASKEIGIGKAASRDGRHVFVVCNYLPAGNCIGRYKENVFPSD